MNPPITPAERILAATLVGDDTQQQNAAIVAIRAHVERENAKLRNQLAETKGELENIQRRVAHVCATLE